MDNHGDSPIVQLEVFYWIFVWNTQKKFMQLNWLLFIKNKKCKQVVIGRNICKIFDPKKDLFSVCGVSTLTTLCWFHLNGIDVHK